MRLVIPDFKPRSESKEGIIQNSGEKSDGFFGPRVDMRTQGGTKLSMKWDQRWDLNHQGCFLGAPVVL